MTTPETEGELVNWCANDPKFFLETFCELPVGDTGFGIPWQFNNIQYHYHHTVYDYVEPHFAVRCENDNIILKSRQYGHSTYELGDLFHSWAWRPGYVGRVIAYADSTAVLLKRIINTFYKSARRHMADDWGLDPDEYLPFADTDNQHEFYCKVTGSLIEFISEGSKGAGRAATCNHLYATEYSEWQNVSDVMSGFGGSLVKDGSAIVSIDFTGRGIGNAAYREYNSAKRGESAYRAHFYGRNDYDYDPAFLEKQRLRLKAKFVQEYPATDEEAFLADDNARFDVNDINACGGYEPETGIYAQDGKYLCDELAPEVLAAMIHSHGIDPSEGVPNGSFCALKTREVTSGAESLPPCRKKLTPRQAAFELKKRMEQAPGIAVIERNNHGHAVIMKCEDLVFEAGPFAGHRMGKFLYRHPEPRKRPTDCTIGWPENKDTKTALETKYESRLEHRSINLPSENGRREAREYCLNANGKTGRPLVKSDDGTRFYDDEAIADMLSIAGFDQAITIVEQFVADEPPAFMVGSMRQEDQE